jgi:cob(I)alamin adenosyltransferase
LTVTARKKRLLELAGSGDDGSTGLLGGGRVPKDHPRIEAAGAVDEASSAIGLARSLSSHARVRAICEEVQRGLYSLGAEVGTNPRARKPFATTTAADVHRLDAIITELEGLVTMPAGFILPGAVPASAAIDLARAVTRRAERRCVTLERAGGLENQQVRRWLNRLSLLLFALARYEEQLSGLSAQAAKRQSV